VTRVTGRSSRGWPNERKGVEKQKGFIKKAFVWKPLGGEVKEQSQFSKKKWGETDNDVRASERA